MLRIVVLISGGGSNLLALLEATATPGFPAEIVAVGSDTDAAGLAYARERGIPHFTVRPADFADRPAWGEALLAEIGAHTPDLVVSAGLMRILPPNVVSALSPHLINTHPALLPLYPGAHAVRDALAAGATRTGVTVHVIDAGVDTGPTIRQAAVDVRPGESEAELHERIKTLERPLLVDVVRDIATQKIILEELNEWPS
ncbi:phosphoribosylglycinamide formyltransferase [Leucobacter sp. M11]|uniref:phosphoribosylglycinamide formyltransferase n=1 Tax=Leucobacter sp. M11 TaxID=2993565 RepID=UPI002D7F4BC2|nr:phosphoribosylglycinamide formyltransferase [Leucobacter sp. M11]MEB4614229.1 phosphoribosylglycinamide formyltransferase [Leucobacter sp. M11]